MREGGLPVFFSIDTGATVYVNTRADLTTAIDERLRALGFRIQTGYVGGPVQAVDEHLF
jgi:phosphomevalonate decarboxylase